MPLNRHHIIAKSMGGAIYEPDNIKMMDIKEHRNLHNLFGVALPHEQINRILQISETAWQPDKIQAIDALLRAFKGDYYHEHCVRKYKETVGEKNKFTQSGLPNYGTQSGR